MAASSISGPQAGPPMSVSDIYAHARGLGAHLRERSAEIDESRRLPADVVARVREAGMFRLAMPKEWGGPELSTIEQVEVIEELSKANASVGWCVAIGCDSGFVTGYLDDRVARKLFPRLDMATAAISSYWPRRPRRRRLQSQRAVDVWFRHHPRRSCHVDVRHF